MLVATALVVLLILAGGDTGDLPTGELHFLVLPPRPARWR